MKLADITKLFTFWNKPNQESTPKEAISVDEHIDEVVSDIFCSSEPLGKKARLHQIEALNALQNHTIGQVSIPTGTGKTYIQMMLHINDIIEKDRNGEFGVYAIVAHRLILCGQLFKEFVHETRFSRNFRCNFLCVNSDGYTLPSLHNLFKNSGISHKDLMTKLNKKDIEVFSTTTIDEISKFVRKSNEEGKHCVIISTYDSFDRLSGLSSIDVCTYDEAHEITKDNFFTSVETIKPIVKRQFFFTATRKESDCRRGMNHTDFYGEVLYQKSPREMIEVGEIVRPNNIHQIQVKNDEGYNYDNPIMTIRAITEGFNQHKLKVKQYSFKPDLIGAKLLVACDGAEQLHSISNDVSFKIWCQQQKIKLFNVDSANGNWVNFEDVKSRNKFIQEMNKLRDDEDAIFLHIKILTEGIDLPSITGVMPIRDMDRTTLTQTLGRATRLIFEDRRRLYLESGEDKIYPNELSKYVKPFAWVVVPTYLLDDTNQILTVINDVYDSYDLRPDWFTETEQYMALPENTLPSILNQEDVNKKFKDGELVHMFTFSELIDIKTKEMTDEHKTKLALKILENFDA